MNRMLTAVFFVGILSSVLHAEVFFLTQEEIDELVQQGIERDRVQREQSQEEDQNNRGNLHLVLRLRGQNSVEPSASTEIQTPNGLDTLTPGDTCGEIDSEQETAPENVTSSLSTQKPTPDGLDTLTPGDTCSEIGSEQEIALENSTSSLSTQTQTPNGLDSLTPAGTPGEIGSEHETTPGNISEDYGCSDDNAFSFEYVAPSVSIEPSGVTSAAFNSEVFGLQYELNRLRNNELKSKNDTIRRQKKDAYDSARWSFDHGELATRLLKEEKYRLLENLLAHTHDDDIRKQAWVRTKAHENMHPLFLFEYSNLLFAEEGNEQEALAYYLLGYRRLVEDTQRLWAGNAQKGTYIKKAVSHFTKKYGAPFLTLEISQSDRKHAIEQGKSIYRPWRKNLAYNIVGKKGIIKRKQTDEQLVDPSWLSSYLVAQRISTFKPWVLPSVKDPICSHSHYGSETVQAMLHSSHRELFGQDGPGQLVHRLTYR